MLETAFLSSHRSLEEKARMLQTEVLKETVPFCIQKETHEKGNSLILIAAFASQFQSQKNGIYEVHLERQKGLIR